MTEKDKQVKSRIPFVELKVRLDDYELSAKASTWEEALYWIATGKMKVRIAALCDFSVTYDSESSQWLLLLPKSIGDAKERIALSLLFMHPESVTRNQLSRMSGIKLDSLHTYLSKSKPEVNSMIQKNQDFVTLNANGIISAVQIFDSIVNIEIQNDGGEDSE